MKQLSFCLSICPTAACGGFAGECPAHTHTFNGPSSRVSRYRKGKTSLDFTEARDSEWQWHQLGHMPVGAA